MDEEIRKMINDGNSIEEIAEDYSNKSCVREFGMDNKQCHEDSDCNDCWIECLEKAMVK